MIVIIIINVVVIVIVVVAAAAVVFWLLMYLCWGINWGDALLLDCWNGVNQRWVRPVTRTQKPIVMWNSLGNGSKAVLTLDNKAEGMKPE